MNAAAAWTVRKTNVMTADEVQQVLDDLRRRGKRSVNTRMNEVVFRLSTVCGLRCSEIAHLRIKDVVLGDKPYVHVFEGKGGKIADVTIPDSGTSVVLERYLRDVRNLNAHGRTKPSDNFLVKTNGKGFLRQEIAKRFDSAIRCLPEGRKDELSIHSGRHTAATMLLDTGHSLATVRDFMRHSNISVTSVYLHGREIEATEMYE